MHETLQSTDKINSVSIVDDVLTIDGEEMPCSIGYLYVLFDDLSDGKQISEFEILDLALIAKLEEMRLTGRTELGDIVALDKLQNSVDKILEFIWRYYSAKGNGNEK